MKLSDEIRINAAGLKTDYSLIKAGGPGSGRHPGYGTQEHVHPGLARVAMKYGYVFKKTRSDFEPHTGQDFSYSYYQHPKGPKVYTHATGSFSSYERGRAKATPEGHRDPGPITRGKGSRELEKHLKAREQKLQNSETAARFQGAVRENRHLVRL